MSQHDFNIANQTFPSFRADLNDALVAAATMSAGSSAPTTPYAYQLWFDTTTDTWKVRNSGNTAWISTITTDLATGNVGIGTSSPSTLLHLSDTKASGGVTLTLENVGDGGVSTTPFVSIDAKLNPTRNGGSIRFGRDSNYGSAADADSHMAFYTALDDTNTERLRITSAGNVGIGTSSPARRLTLHNSGATTSHIQMTNSTTGEAGANGVLFGVNGSGEVELWNYEATAMRFAISGGEKMQLDSSGNLLVGTTSDNPAGTNVQGIALTAAGQIDASRNGGSLDLNRISTDGAIATFRKNGSAMGSIGSAGGGTEIYFTGTVSGTAGLYMANSSRVVPMSSGAIIDNGVDMGHPSYRFDDVFATNGTIQTSDANEKQQIAALTDAEMTAAKAISALFKTFKWNSAVEAKGDAARTHTGVIAQDVQAAMTAAGLDAGDYAFFISTTWWETQTEVPAVEAVEAVLDEDGNVVTEAVEAVAAYTRTDTYDTAEEAPEGATERTRLGIRYPELLAFIGAATEQRLSNIETRLAALEA